MYDTTARIADFDDQVETLGHALEELARDAYLIQSALKAFFRSQEVIKEAPTAREIADFTNPGNHCDCATQHTF